MRHLLLLALVPLFACHPKPKPDPLYPIIGDAGVPPDAAPTDCSKFAGKWKAVDTVTMVEGTCKPGQVNELLTLDAFEFPEEQANEGWRAVVTTQQGMVLSGPASQVEERPWTCRFVVEASEAPAGALGTRDFLLGEVPDRGRGEATGRNGDCVWKTATSLERF